MHRHIFTFTSDFNFGLYIRIGSYFGHGRCLSHLSHFTVDESYSLSALQIVKKTDNVVKDQERINVIDFHFQILQIRKLRVSPLFKICTWVFSTLCHKTRNLSWNQFRRLLVTMTFCSHGFKNCAKFSFMKLRAKAASQIPWNTIIFALVLVKLLLLFVICCCCCCYYCCCCCLWWWWWSCCGGSGSSGKNVKQSHNRPGQAHRVPESSGSQISRQTAHEGGRVASPTHRPPLPPSKYSWYSFLLQAESTPGS